MSRFGATVRCTEHTPGVGLLSIDGRFGTLQQEYVPLELDHPMTRAAIRGCAKDFDVPIEEIRSAIKACAGPRREAHSPKPATTRLAAGATANGERPPPAAPSTRPRPVGAGAAPPPVREELF